MLLTGYSIFNCEEVTQIISTGELNIYESVQKNNLEGFPGGTVVKNPPANAGDGTRVQALVWEDPICHRATKPVRHNY